MCIRDRTYTIDVNGMDASEKQVVTIANHDFQSGIYRIDVKTLFDNTDPLQKWYNESEVNLANNYTTIMFSIASADITLMQPDILDCTTDITYACVYTCLLYTSPSPRDRTRSRMPSSA